MLDSLTHFVSLFDSWGYLVIFVIVALECQAILGLFMPGESLVLIAGFLAQQGTFDPGVLAFVIAAAAISGDSIGYELGQASEIIGGAILLAIVLGWLWHWLVRHEADVIRRWQSAVEHPRVVALRRHLAPQLQFLRDRLSPEGYLGLQMTIGLSFFVGAAWLFGSIAEDVMHGDPLTVIDKDVALWLHERTTPGMLAVMQFITDLASPVWVTAVSSLIAIVLFWKRYWYRLLAFVLVFPGGMVLTSLLKIALHRSRPSFTGSTAIFQSYSFPSGHTMAAILLYGMLAVLGVIALDRWRWRVGIVIGACITVLLVGFSRMYLGAHYLSDVLAAIAFGFAWLALCLTAVNTLQRYRIHRDTRE